ncbi:MAG: TonB-dependent receptor [Novosphingobium sp.]
MTKFFANEESARTLPVSWKRGIYVAGLLCGTALTLPTGTAIAQERREPTNTSVPGEDAQIVVTARRKDEALTSVPASITAISSANLQKQNIRSFTDYATKIPNLSFQYGQGGEVLWSGDRSTTIRGVVGIGTTAYYINDTPIPPSVSPQTLNLERIEVLKGPQGTLFGASSMGGTLRFITKKPSLSQTGGSVQVQGGATRGGDLDFDGNAMANLVLVPDRIALDLAFGYTRDSGYITRRFPDASSGKLISRKGQGRNDTYVGSATLRLKLTDTLEATVNAIGQTGKLHGFPAAYVPLPGYKPLSYTVDRDRDVQEYSKDRWGIASLVLHYTGDGFSAISSSSYFKRRIHELEDDTEGTNQFFDAQAKELERPPFFVRPPAFFVISLAKEQRLTQEMRLSFDKGRILPNLSGIVGFFYQRRKSSSDTPGIFVQEMEDAGLAPPYLSASIAETRKTDTAFFGEVYYEPVPKLTLTLGLRKYWATFNRPGSTDTGYIYGETGQAENPTLHNKESGWVPKAVLSYEIGDSGNIYASVSKGFRAGGSQARLPDFCAKDLSKLGLTVNDIGQYKSDTLWSYEVGAKSRLADGRLNASVAAFRMDWSHIQQNALLPICGFPFTTNAGKARINGGEAEISGRPFAGVPLSIQLGLGYTDATLKDPGLLIQAPNSPLGLVPKWTGTVSGYYETPVSQGASLFVAADYSYTSSVKVPDGLGGFLTRQPINMINGNFGVNFGRSQIMVYVKNLLDKRLNYGDQPSSSFDRKDGSSQRLPRGTVSRPRQIGVQYRLDF